MDWNIALDETGGPNHVNNLCDAPIIIDTNKKEAIYNSSYYYIAHFSKFIKKNAIRIDSSVIADKIYAVSCINADDSLCIVVMNENDEEKTISLNVCNDSINVSLQANSIYTIIRKL